MIGSRQIAVLLCCLCAPVLLGDPAMAQSVGVTAAVNQSAVGTPPSDKPRIMTLGEKIIHNEQIKTNNVGLLQILLADGTSFTVGPNSSMTIDSFVYDPAAGTAKVVATLGKGVFRFIGGKTSKSPDGAVLNTPVGTVGIRGGISNMDFHGGKGTPFHIDMLFGDSITLSNHGTVLGHIFHAGYSIAIGPDGKATVQKTPPGWIQSFQHNLAGHAGQHGGSSHPGAVSTAVAEVFKSTDTGAPSTQGTLPPGTTTVADGSYVPPVPFTPPETSSIAQWGEINNSDLAGMYAEYQGNYAFTATPMHLPPGTSSVDVAGQFALDYYFGAEHGNGTLTFMPPDGVEEDPISLGVTPNTTTGDGNAGFAGSTVLPTTYSIPDFSSSVAYGDLNVTGTFANTGAGTAHGVSGSIDYHANYEPFYGPGDHFYDNGSLNVTGSFGGNLNHVEPGG